MKGTNRQHIKYRDQKRLAHRYSRFMYQLLADGSFYDLPTAKKIKGLPVKGTFDYMNIPYLWSGQHNSDFIHVKYFDKIYHCADFMHGYYNENTDQSSIQGGIFCKSAFCPICQVRKAIREYSKLMYNIELLGDQYEYYFLTVTLPNNMDGFGEEIKILKRASQNFLHYFGYEGKCGSECLSPGVYGSYEITVSQERGWHPHLHMLIAYPKKYVKSYKDHCWFDDKGRQIWFCDEFIVQGNKRKISLNYDKIVQLWIRTLKNITDKYNDRFEHLNWFNVNFCKVKDVLGGVNELAKYLIDFRQIETPEQLYIYMRDSHNLTQRMARGCFRMSQEDYEKYHEHLEMIHSQENANFIQSGALHGEFKFVCGKYKFVYPVTVVRQIPFTNQTYESNEFRVIQLE